MGIERNRPYETNAPQETRLPYEYGGTPFALPAGSSDYTQGFGEITAPGNSPEAHDAELIDIVDADGNPTGVVAGKSDIHRLGLWHRDVHIWVTDGENLLEQRRALDKSIMPGEWDISAAGHVGSGESYREAGVRETVEETGLYVEPQELKPAGILAVEMAMEGGAWTHRVIGDNFVMYRPGLRLNDLRLQVSEVMDARLYPIDQLEADLADPETARRHAPQPLELWQLGIAAMRQVVREQQ